MAFRFAFPIHCSYRTKYNVILFDDANEVNEAMSTVLLLFSPSALILFGDPVKKPVDMLEIDKKYPRHNLNQSMFERLRKFKRCVLHLNGQHRFGADVSDFVSKCFYGGGITECRKSNLNYVRMYHRQTDGFCYKLIKNMQRHIDPRTFKYGIIHPPNVKKESIVEVLG